MLIDTYAEMALRTSVTRSYLMGESAKRDEWGINTVIVARRGAACPKCLQYVGRVFYDDVYGNIPVPDDKYPRLSAAIAGGLYHPNCKDIHTTYFEGVSTPPKPLTSAQEKRAAEIYDLEQRQRYNERQIRKFRRLAENTLDPEQKQKYTARLKQWEQVNADFVEAHGDVLKRRYEREDIRELAVRVEKPSIRGLSKSVEVKGGFNETKIIPDDIKKEIVDKIDCVLEKYDTHIDEIVLDTVSSGNVPLQYQPVNENGQYKSRFVVNVKFNWEDSLDKMNDRIYNRNYKNGILASQTMEDLIWHEMAHIMSFQDCVTYEDFLRRERALRNLYIAGVSGYSDAMEDGAETIAEGFVRIKNNEKVDDRVTGYINEYIERWRK